MSAWLQCVCRACGWSSRPMFNDCDLPVFDGVALCPKCGCTDGRVRVQVRAIGGAAGELARLLAASEVARRVVEGGVRPV